MKSLDDIRYQLRLRKGQWRRVASESGVSHRAIYNIVYAKNDPRVSTVQALSEWLDGAPPVPTETKEVA